MAKQKLGIPVNQQTGTLLDGSIDDYIGDIYAPIADPAEPPAPEQSGVIRRVVGDSLVTGLKGAIGVPEAAVGVADIVAGGRIGRALENDGGALGFRPQQAREFLDEFYSPEQRAAFQEVQQAANPEDPLHQRVIDTGAAALRNPSTIVHAVGESLPLMGAGGVLARGALAATGATSRAAQIAAAGLGEGAMTAGSSAEQIRQQTPDGTLSMKQAGLAAASGAATMGIGVIAGRAAARLGIGDIDVMIAGGKHVDPGMQKAFVRRVLEGALTEGVMEELPQSIQEQVAQNYALGKPLDDGVDQAAVMGMLSGGAMGAGAQLMTRPAVPNVGPLSKAANIAAAGVAPAAQQAPEAPAAPGVAPQAPEAPAAPVSPEVGQQLLEHANKRMAELTAKQKGSKGDDGAEVPAQFLTPQEDGELEFLKAAGGDVNALARAYVPVDVEPGSTTEDAAAAPAPLNAREQRERDRPSDPTEKHLPTDITRSDGHPFVSMDAAMRARDTAGDGAEIVRVVGGLVVRKPGAKELPAPLPEDVLNPKGDPFTSRGAAVIKMKALGDGWTVTKVRGGFAVRRVATESKTTDNGDPATSQEATQAASDQAPADARSEDARGSGDGEAGAADVPGAGAADVQAARVDEIADAAHEAATSPLNDRQEPTDAQKEAGNYAKGHVRISGLDVTIENPSGSIRRSKADAPTPWQVEMPYHYGYIKRTEGADGDHVDIGIGPKGENGRFWVINQHHADKPDSFDEHKVFTGVESADEAIDLYKRSFADNFGDRVFSSISDEMTADELKSQLPDLSRPEPVAPSESAPAEVDEQTGLREASADDLEALQERGQQVVSIMDATRRFDAGERLFVSHEMAEEDPKEVVSIDALRGYTADQMMALPPEAADADEGVSDADIKATHDEDAPQARWTRATEADRLAILGRAGWAVTPPSLSAQRTARLAWEKLSQSQKDRITEALEGTATEAPPAAAPEKPENHVIAFGKAMRSAGLEMDGRDVRSWSADVGERGEVHARLDERGAGTIVYSVHSLLDGKDHRSTATVKMADAVASVGEFRDELLKDEKKAPAAGPESDLAQPGAQDDNEPATKPADATAVPTRELPAGGEGEARPDAPAGSGNRESVDDGLAQAGEGPPGGGAVPGSARDAGGERTGRPGEPGESAPGEARDSGAVRADAGAAGGVDPATAPTSDKPALDHDLDAEDIGKGGLRAKYRDNIAAIRILKSMEAEGRVATPDERRQIARYVGWGALKGVFDHANKQLASEYEELKGLLTDSEYKAARASMLNAHYTSPTVVQAMFKALERMGFTRGRVLEPSVGVGNFFGLMPRDMRAGSQLHGVELDPLTSKIAAALYPNAKIAQATGFQNFDIPSEYFDLAIGNPPFGSEPIVDAARSAYSGFSIHNYFFAKSIDKLRPGGLMVMVVSHSFLDAKDARARQWIAERANLVGAVRLPNTAFKENAGTEVVTDILVFQKKDQNQQQVAEQDWTGTTDIELTGSKSGEASKHTIGSYFAAHPHHVLGTQTAAGSMYRSDEYTVEPAGDFELKLAKWADNLPAEIYTPIERDHELEAADAEIPDGVKVGSFFVGQDGKVRVRGNDVMGRRTARGWDAPNGKAEERIRGMVGLRDALRTQMRLERSQDAGEAEIEAGRAALNKLYDAFKKAHGFLNDQTNRRLFADDTEAALVQALEFDYDKGISTAVAAREGIEPRAPKADKADIFSRRVLFPPADHIKVTNAKDALLASLNYRGRVDMPYMQELYDRTSEQIVEELGEVVFDDPLVGMVTADDYLSGDVKTKLAEAESAARDRPELQRNVEALRKVIPVDKKPSEIHASLGAAFLPADVYVEFAKHITGGVAQAQYIGATGQWILNIMGRTDPALMTGQWGTSRLNAGELISLTMGGRVAVVKDTVRNADGSTTTYVNEKDTEQAREKQNAIKAEWQSWLWKDAERADRVATIYNDKMNRIVNRRFDGSHMTFPGMSPAIHLLEHQRNAVWRGLQDRQLLLDHVVGAGKTFEMAALAMEMRRLGIARKPLLAVPNHLTLQWRSEFTRLYPAANVLAATPDDFAKGNREKFFSKVVTGDWDAVIIGHSSLKKIGLPAETEQRVLQEQIEEISDAIEAMKRERGDKHIIRDMEKIKANLDAKLQTKLQKIGKRDKVVTFDELGIDAFMVDELHEFKNLTYHSTMDRVPGMGNPGGSDKSFDLFVKLQWMNEAYGDSAPIVGATGTPVSNSLVEMYNMQRFLQYPTLKREGLHVFDAWAKQFGKVESVYEVAPSGTGYRASSRFSKFANLPALMGHYLSFSDVVTLDDLKAQEEAQGKRFPVPKVAGGRPQNIVAERSPLVASFMGVPELKMADSGDPLFGINLSEAIEPIVSETPEGKFKAVVRMTWDDGKQGETDLGTFETEADARAAIVEKALTPQVGVDPGSILGQFENLRQLMRESKGKINALSLTGAANKAGLDFRLINPAAPDFPGSKINLAIDKMMATYAKWAKDKGTQLVFCDLSVPLSARSGFESKDRRLYVREDGALAAKRGTMHAVEGFEFLPYFIVPTTEGGAKVFSVYDAATGMLARGRLESKAAAKAWADETIRDEAKRVRWIEGRERAGEVSQEEIDDYNTTHEIDTEESPGITREDIAGMSGSAKFSVYDDIRAKLIARGIPEAEIAFIHDYQTPVAKDKLFKAVNAGQVRFLLGSTPKMGAGTNVQKRLVALHHIDAPWRPSDLEQREGRIIRRGNSLYERNPGGFEVEIYRYATAQTYDTRRWQILEHKERGIEQLRKYDGTINEIEDIDGEAANAADMKAAASGDPLILEETRLRNEVRRLENLETAHADEVQMLNRRARDAAAFAQEYGPKELGVLREFQAAVAKVPMPADGSLPFSINGQRIADKEKAVEAITRKVAEAMVGQVSAFKMSFRGITFEMTREGERLRLDSPLGLMDTWKLGATVSPAGMFQRFENWIERLASHAADTEARIKRASENAVGMREQAKKPWAQAEDLTKTRAAHKKVQRRLLAKGPAIQDAQKPLLDSATGRQQDALRAQGFGDALDEFIGQRKAADEAMFSRSPGGGEMTATRVRAIVAAIRSKWTNAPEVVVVQSILDPEVPGHVREQARVMLSRGGSDAGVPEGFFDPNDRRVFLIADEMVTEHDVARVLMHESLGHYGLRGVYGDALGTILDRLATLNAGTVRKAAKRLGFDFGDQQQRRMAAEEVLAHMAQATPALGWVRRAIAAIRTWLREHIPGFGNMALSDSEIIRDYLLPARRWVELGPNGDGPVRGRRTSPSFDDLPLWSLTNNASGESAASVEAQGRLAQAKQFGRQTVRVGRDGVVTPIRGVTTADTRAYAGQVVLQKNVGSGDWTVMAQGDGVKQSDIARAVSRARDHARAAPALFSLAGGVNDVRDFSLPSGYVLGDLFTSAAGAPGRLGWWHKTVGSMYHLAQKNASFRRVYDAVQGFLNDVSYYAAESADLAPSILPKLEHFRDIWKSPLSAEDTKALSAPVFEGTLTWARDEKGRARRVQDIVDELGIIDVHAKAHKLLQAGHVAPEVLRMWQGLPIERYEQIIAGKFEREFLRPGIVFTSDELREHFGLNDRQIGHYLEFRAAIDKSLTNLAIADMIRYGGADVEAVRDTALAAGDVVGASTILRDHLFRLSEEQPERAELLNGMGNTVVGKSDRAQDLMGRGYAPLSRFGQYTLDVVDANGERVYFGLFESSMERSKMARQLREDFPGATVMQGTVSTEAYKLFAGVSPETLELFGEMLGMESTGDDAKDRAFQEYLKLARSTRDSMKRMIHRKGIAGFSEDAGRVLAGFVYSNARQTASNLHMKELDAAVGDIPKGQGQLQDEAVKLRDYVKNPREEAQGFRGILFAQYLGGSVASAIVNATQPFAVTFPYLSQFGGVRAAGGRLSKALADMREGAQLEPGLAEALKKAEEEGIVSPQEVHHLMAQAMGRAQLKSGDGTRLGDASAKLNNVTSKLSLAWGKVFGLAEQFNRKLTFIAAYRTAAEQGIADPAKFAEQAVAETQFTYNKGNKPRWARGAVGSVLFTFKQYSVNYVELLHRMATAGEPGSPERAAGRRAAVLALAVLFLMAGADGLPFVEDVQDVIDGALQRMGYNFSSKQQLRQFLANQIGLGGAEFMMSGVSGLPGVPIDVSGRLGLGNLIPGTGLLQKKPDHTRDVLEVLGAGGDFAKRTLAAADQITSGEVGKAIETMMPTAARNLAKSYDMAVTGMYRDQNGRRVLDTSIGEAIAKGIGFQPRDVARVQEASMEAQKAKGVYNISADEIRDRWALGIFEGDASKIEAAREALADWNRRNPDQPIRPNMPAILARVRKMRETKAQRIAGTAPKAIRERVRRELAEAEE